MTGFLFDLDGVIIDSETEYSKIWAKINEEYPTGIDSFEKVIKGCTLHNILNDYYPEPDIQDKVVETLYDLESKMNYDYKEGAESFLSRLKALGQPIALVTSSNNDKMNHLQEEMPCLLPTFDYVVTGDMVENSKPHPEGYLLAAEKINCNPEKCIVFEDSLQGVKAAKNAGAFVVGISGTLSADTLMPFSDIVIESLIQLDIEELLKTIAER